MPLSKSIVIVNEFSTRTKKGGTRGGTPGQYVLRYMARSSAVETLSPVRRNDIEPFVLRYMARRSATEAAFSTDQVRKGIERIDGLGGVAFGSAGRNDPIDLSLSDSKVRAISRQLQEAFIGGKTALKTVISFDEEYLRETGIIEPEFHAEYRGDYRGHIDQMKLRTAIAHGISRLSRRFDDLAWVGVIQVDTMHVHCHLCMVDMGPGRLLDNGQQRGKLNKTDRTIIRRSIDMALNDMHPVKMLSSSVVMDRRNARAFVKRFTHEIMAEHGVAQFIMACLPDDRRLWRASTNRKEMRQANAVCREYVSSVLAQPDSGYTEAMRDIQRYASERARREGLSEYEEQRLIDNGREKLMEDCVNGVYRMLMRVDKEALTTRTPMLDAMSLDWQDVAARRSDPVMEFGLRLRSYSSRLEHHRQEYTSYHAVVEDFELMRRQGGVHPDALALLELYREEEEYHDMLMSKYQHFLRFVPHDPSVMRDLAKLRDYGERVRSTEAMSRDSDVSRRGPDDAEAYGLQVYGVPGGHLASEGSSLLRERATRMKLLYGERLGEFAEQLHYRGLLLDASDDGGVEVHRGTRYAFDDVKALDLHHMGFDFPYDAAISEHNVRVFSQRAALRAGRLADAIDYLERSGQSAFIDTLPIDDVNAMNQMASRLTGKPVLPSRTAQVVASQGKGRTFSLALDMTHDIDRAVRESVANTRGQQFGG